MVRLEARNHTLIDGDIVASGEHANVLRTGGASGGSIWITSSSMSGKFSVENSFTAI